jgi:hypothetical protein
MATLCRICVPKYHASMRPVLALSGWAYATLVRSAMSAEYAALHATASQILAV